MKNPNAIYTGNGHLSQDQLQRYQADAMAPAEMHLVERHVLDCTLCSDALEGMLLLAPEQQQLAIEEVKEKLRERIGQEKAAPAYWKWGVAASVLLLLSLSLYLAFDITQSSEMPLAQQEETTVEGNSTKEAPVQIFSTDPAAIEDEIITDTPTSRSVTNARTEISAAPAMPIPAQPQLSEQADLIEVYPAEEEEAAPSLPEALAGRAAGVNIVEESKSAATEKAALAQKPITQPVTQQSDYKTTLAPPASQNIRIRGSSSFLPPSNFRGQVVDASSGEPLPGVGVRVKGNTNGAVTDINGNYTLTLPDSISTLQISFIGYKDHILLAKPSGSLQIARLEENVESLSEQVVGLGYQEDSKNRTAAVSSVAKENTITTKPLPAEGDKAFRRYLKKNLRYPQAAAEAQIEGDVVVEFYVEANGTLSEIQVLTTPSSLLNKEAIRLIKEGPLWQPAISGGRAVRQKTTVSIPFRQSK